MSYACFASADSKMEGKIEACNELPKDELCKSLEILRENACNQVEGNYTIISQRMKEDLSFSKVNALFSSQNESYLGKAGLQMISSILEKEKEKKNRVINHSTEARSLEEVMALLVQAKKRDTEQREDISMPGSRQTQSYPVIRASIEMRNEKSKENQSNTSKNIVTSREVQTQKREVTAYRMNDKMKELMCTKGHAKYQSEKTLQFNFRSDKSLLDSEVSTNDNQESVSDGSTISGSVLQKGEHQLGISVLNAVAETEKRVKLMSDERDNLLFEVKKMKSVINQSNENLFGSDCDDCSETSSVDFETWKSERLKSMHIDKNEIDEMENLSKEQVFSSSECAEKNSNTNEIDRQEVSDMKKCIRTENIDELSQSNFNICESELKRKDIEINELGQRSAGNVFQEKMEKMKSVIEYSTALLAESEERNLKIREKLAVVTIERDSFDCKTRQISKEKQDLELKINDVEKEFENFRKKGFIENRSDCDQEYAEEILNISDKVSSDISLLREQLSAAYDEINNLKEEKRQISDLMEETKVSPEKLIETRDVNQNGEISKLTADFSIKICAEIEKTKAALREIKRSKDEMLEYSDGGAKMEKMKEERTIILQKVENMKSVVIFGQESLIESEVQRKKLQKEFSVCIGEKRKFEEKMHSYLKEIKVLESKLCEKGQQCTNLLQSERISKELFQAKLDAKKKEHYEMLEKHEKTLQLVDEMKKDAIAECNPCNWYQLSM